MNKNKTKKSKNKRKGTCWMLGGLLLLVAALLLTIYNVYEGNQAGEASDKVAEILMERIVAAREENTSEESSLKETESGIEEDAVLETILGMEEVPDYEKYPEMEMPSYEIDGERYIGVLEVPDLDLALPIMGGDWSYAKLRIAPCRYSGSVYQDDLIVAAHNYSRHFGKLRNLPVGTMIRFIDVDGNVFTYEIGWIEVLNGNAVEAMSSGEDWDLTLFTCVYSGRQRYTIRCIRVE